jgi:hypothetical protein
VIRLLYSSLLLAWALWFGGMVALLIFVTRLFKASREIGVSAAPVLFRTFAGYQFVVGGLTVALAVALLIASRSKAVTVFGALAVVALALAFPIRAWTYRIGELYAAGQSQSEEFKAIHRMSSATYSTSALLLLIAGIALVSAPRSRERSGTFRTTPQG